MQGQQIQADAGLSQPQFSRFRFSGRFVCFWQINRRCHKCAAVSVINAPPFWWFVNLLCLT